MDRRKFFKSGISKIIEATIATTQLMSEIQLDRLNQKKTFSPAKKSKPSFTRAKRPKKGLKYPPGAVENFLSKCIGCNDCVNACPYNSIIPIYNERLGKDIPQMDVNMSACYMCSDWPCISACLPKALKTLQKNELPVFGKVNFESSYCLNNDMAEPICTACKDICPLDSVSFSAQGIKFDKSCTGCGICVKSCPTFPKPLLVK